MHIVYHTVLKSAQKWREREIEREKTRQGNRALDKKMSQHLQYISRYKLRGHCYGNRVYHRLDGKVN